jgi:hypothetical protein
MNLCGEDARYVDISTREELWRYKYNIAVERFRRGLEGEATFRAVLIILGYRGREIDAEVNLARLGQWPMLSN